MDDDLETLLTGVGIIILWFMMSQALGEWITENYYLIETICLLLIFGFIYQVWTSSAGEFDFLDMMIFGGNELNRTMAQFFLVFGVSSLVFSSIVLRNAVEARFGTLAVVQLLAFIAIISRMFVNVRVTGDAREILDGRKDTYMVYTVGVLAILLSFWLRGMYSPYTVRHNAVVIFLSTIIPFAVFYMALSDWDLPSLKDSANRRQI